MPAATMSAELTTTGQNTDPKCGDDTEDGIEDCANTASTATPPPGGCKHRPRNINTMANATAALAAQAVSGIHSAQTQAATTEMALPATTAQGWASGLAGKTNTSTAEAPIGAVNQSGPPHQRQLAWLSSAVKAMPRAAPSAARVRSRASTGDARGCRATISRFNVSMTPL